MGFVLLSPVRHFESLTPSVNLQPFLSPSLKEENGDLMRQLREQQQATQLLQLQQELATNTVSNREMYAPFSSSGENS